MKKKDIFEYAQSVRQKGHNKRSTWVLAVQIVIMVFSTFTSQRSINMDDFPATDQHMGWLLERLLTGWSDSWTGEAHLGTDEHGRYCVRAEFKNPMGWKKKYIIRIEEQRELATDV